MHYNAHIKNVSKCIKSIFICEHKKIGARLYSDAEACPLFDDFFSLLSCLKTAHTADYTCSNEFETSLKRYLQSVEKITLSLPDYDIISTLLYELEAHLLRFIADGSSENELVCSHLAIASLVKTVKENKVTIFFAKSTQPLRLKFIHKDYSIALQKALCAFDDDTLTNNEFLEISEEFENKICSLIPTEELAS